MCANRSSTLFELTNNTDEATRVSDRGLLVVMRCFQNNTNERIVRSVGSRRTMNYLQMGATDGGKRRPRNGGVVDDGASDAERDGTR